ncbi:hypothetical protein [Plasmodium yoelii yoelii]|uniref:Uncharacterized protein n=1 Tax=Plasmodium yoelii yoelii TaxID=73239 RepID=Q7RAR3_PLAYO|nr:hypothetical protein [Plasmodium yoelii yoelii]
MYAFIRFISLIYFIFN